MAQDCTIAPAILVIPPIVAIEESAERFDVVRDEEEWVTLNDGCYQRRRLPAAE